MPVVAIGVGLIILGVMLSIVIILTVCKSAPIVDTTSLHRTYVWLPCRVNTKSDQVFYVEDSGMMVSLKIADDPVEIMCVLQANASVMELNSPFYKTYLCQKGHIAINPKTKRYVLAVFTSVVGCEIAFTILGRLSSEEPASFTVATLNALYATNTDLPITPDLLVWVSDMLTQHERS